MRLFQFYHHHKVGELIPSDFWLFELSIWLHVLARSLITIFIPILMLKIGFGIGDIIIYYLIYNLFDVPLNFLARRLIRQVGARWVIVGGTLFTIAFFVAFSWLTAGNWPLLVLLALLAAFYDSFYWVAHLFLFIESNKNVSDVGKNTGVLYSVKKFAGFLGPAIGAGILIFFGQQALIIASIIIFTLSIIPLLKVDEFKDKPTEKQLSFKEFFKYPEEWKNYASSTLYAIHSEAELVLFPLLIFVVFGTVESVAVIPIIVSVTAIIFSYFIGRANGGYKGKMIVLGSALIAATWILRIALDSQMFYYFSIFLVGLFSLLVGIPIDSNVFRRARETDALSASTYRNTFHMFIKFLLYAILALFVNVFHISFLLATLSLFGVIAVHSFFTLKQKGSDDIAFYNH